jgi:hypothetical protein
MAQQLGFPTSGFHRFSSTKPIPSETNKAEPRSNGDHSSIRDFSPIALISGYPRGPRVETNRRNLTQALPRFVLQVGGELGISEITVKAHRGKVMQKMKADSLPDLVKMAGKFSPALAKP